MSSFPTKQVQASSPDVSELEAAIIRQIEYYFSYENWIKDAWLQKQANPETGFVSLQLVAGFKLVTKLTTDYQTILSAVRKSPNLTIDESGMLIKSNRKQQRNTIILLDIAVSTPEQDVRALFHGAPTITSVRAEAGDLWFVTFESNDAALAAHELVSQRQFHGQPVHARIKTETAPPVVSRSAPVSPMDMPYSPFQQQMPYGYGFPPQPYMNMMPPPMFPGQMMMQPPPPLMQHPQDRRQGQDRRGLQGMGPRKPRRELTAPVSPTGMMPPPYAPAMTPSGADFPPLVGARVSRGGYQAPYRQYGRADFTAIVSANPPPDRPAELADADPAVLLAAPVQSLQIAEPLLDTPQVLDPPRTRSHSDHRTVAEVVAAAPRPVTPPQAQPQSTTTAAPTTASTPPRRAKGSKSSKDTSGSNTSNANSAAPGSPAEPDAPASPGKAKTWASLVAKPSDITTSQPPSSPPSSPQAQQRSPKKAPRSTA